jgi:hypothetical protein
LELSELFRLKGRVAAAEVKGRDLLIEMVEEMMQIHNVKTRLDELKAGACP